MQVFERKDHRVVRIVLGTSNAYLVWGARGFLLVDAGSGGNLGRLESALKKLSLHWDDCHGLVVTHAHFDHVGDLEAIKRQSQAPVICHRLEASHLRRGEAPLPRGTHPLTQVVVKAGESFFPNLKSFAAVYPDQVLDGESDYSGLGVPVQLVPTPGHTAGSLSVIVDGTDAMVGDSLYSRLPGIIFPPFANAPSLLLASWEKMLRKGCATFFPGHGPPLQAKAALSELERRQEENYRSPAAVR